MFLLLSRHAIESMRPPIPSDFHWNSEEHLPRPGSLVRRLRLLISLPPARRRLFFEALVLTAAARLACGRFQTAAC